MHICVQVWQVSWESEKIVKGVAIWKKFDDIHPSIYPSVTYIISSAGWLQAAAIKAL